VTAGVVDCSIALTWCSEDEASPETDRLFESVRDEGAVVRGLWHLEVANVLLQAERRGRISRADLTRRLILILDLPIAIDPEMTSRAWRETLSLARAENLTAYDAAYLELAERRNLPLMTRDSELGAAAKRLGVIVFP
jgi:predicted nucleic acid-binding protein